MANLTFKKYEFDIDPKKYTHALNVQKKRYKICQEYPGHSWAGYLDENFVEWRWSELYKETDRLTMSRRRKVEPGMGGVWGQRYYFVGADQNAWVQLWPIDEIHQPQDKIAEDVEARYYKATYNVVSNTLEPYQLAYDDVLKCAVKIIYCVYVHRPPDGKQYLTRSVYHVPYRDDDAEEITKKLMEEANRRAFRSVVQQKVVENVKKKRAIPVYTKEELEQQQEQIRLAAVALANEKIREEILHESSDQARRRLNRERRAGKRKGQRPKRNNGPVIDLTGDEVIDLTEDDPMTEFDNYIELSSKDIEMAVKDPIGTFLEAKRAIDDYEALSNSIATKRFKGEQVTATEVMDEHLKRALRWRAEAKAQYATNIMSEQEFYQNDYDDNDI